MSVVIHEVAHGYAALWQGDPTAKYEGRLTMNPIKHLDLFGSFIVPLVLALMPGNFILGWAKPVPYNPYNLKNQKWGELLVAIAGPISNILIALLFSMFMRFYVVGSANDSMFEITLTVIIINLYLAVFNMVPIPPLDGSKVLFGLLPAKYLYIRTFIEKYSFVLILAFFLFFLNALQPIVSFLFTLMTGLN